ncbi:MAG: rhodanese-like domain-containing protein [Bacillota bacterium]
MNRRALRLTALALTLAVTLVTVLAGCSKGPSEFDQLAAQADKYLSLGRAPTISAEDVQNKIIIGKDPSYFLLSVRKPEDDAKGHVPGAITIPFNQIYKAENLAKLPKDKKIVVICYTGHTASQTVALLNLLGYEAYAMKFGMSAWTDNKDILGMAVPALNPGNYPMDTAVNNGKPDNTPPVLKTGKKGLNAIILARAEAYLSAGKPATIAAEEVYNKAIVGKDPSYFVVSIRSNEHDAKGHIPGAITIPFKEIAKPDNLKKLPTNKKIVVVCYTGHTASQAAMILQLLGYDAYAMKFGMSAWTDNKEVLAVKPYDSKPLNYVTEPGK